MAARFSIGIDLGTTNSALAYVPLTGDARPEALVVSQWESPAALAESPTLPSFLYLPEDGRAAELPGRVRETEGWIAGLFARRRAGETPGRVVRSAKSWLCHHSADRSAPILPWGSEDLAPAQKISPVRAAALILSHLRGAWDSRFAGWRPLAPAGVLLARKFSTPSYTALPASLSDGQTAYLYVSFLYIANKLKERKQNGETRLTPVCEDSAGGIYKGESWDVDPDKMVPLA